MAWSSGQRRSLHLQWSRVKISALPSFLAVKTTEAERSKQDVWDLNEGGRGEIRWIDRQAKVEWNMQKEDGSLRRQLNR